MRVLIPTDFSSNAWQTMQYTLQLMQNVKCAFTILHTYELPNSSSGEIISLHDQLKANAEVKLSEFKTRATAIANPKLHQFNSEALHGDFIRVVNRYAQDEKMDLMAISMTNKFYPDKTHHKGYAKRIVEYSKCPVLIIPDCFQSDGKVKENDKVSV